MAKKPRVMVAMSGGVDSSVVAGLMVRRGYDVVGVTMQIWQESQTDPRHAGCCSLGAVEDARGVARKLGIPYYVINFKQEFKQAVIDDFIDEYERGRTPNPCIRCNRHVKFDALLGKAREVGCDLLATGHYARVRRRGLEFGVQRLDRNDAAPNSQLQTPNSRFRLLRARSKEKDQSYALYSMSQEQLSRVTFPLGELPSKRQTRLMAREMGLRVADKPDSQEICFVSEAGGYTEFLRKARPEMFSQGEIVTDEGKVLGEHGGVGLFTVGQRKRLRLNVDGKPLFVLRLEPKANRVVVGSDDRLLTREVVFDDQLGLLNEATTVTGRIRYNMEPTKAALQPGKLFTAAFKDPVRAVTPGQAAVFYRGETVIAGGPIV